MGDGSSPTSWGWEICSRYPKLLSVKSDRYALHWEWSSLLFLIALLARTLISRDREAVFDAGIEPEKADKVRLHLIELRISGPLGIARDQNYAIDVVILEAFLPVIWIIPAFTPSSPTLQIGKHAAKKGTSLQAVTLVLHQLEAEVSDISHTRMGPGGITTGLPSSGHSR